MVDDMLGLNDKAAKFIRNFLKRETNIKEAIESYVVAVKDGSFPAQLLFLKNYATK